MGPKPRGGVIRREQGAAYHWLGGTTLFYALGPDTGGGYAAWVDAPPPGGGPVWHTHTREEEWFYVLEGELTYRTAADPGAAFLARPGAFIGLPKGVPHVFRNGDAPARVLLGVAPAGNEYLFLELSAPLDESVDPTVPPDPVRFAEVGRRHGITQFGPELDRPGDQVLALGRGRAPILLEPGAGESVSAVGLRFDFKAEGGRTDGAYTIIELLVAPGGGAPPHRHARFEEGFFVLEGTLAVTLDGEELETPPERWVVVPQGAVHGFTNRGDAPARMLSMTTPGGIEDYFRAACRPVGPGAAPVAPDDRDVEALARLGPQYGVEILPGGGRG